jgi:hypothetical protein
MGGTLSVTVAGLSGSGKTSVGIAMRDALTKLGFSVEFEDVDADPQDEQHNDLKLRNLPLTTAIVIRTQNCGRSIFKSVNQSAPRRHCQTCGFVNRYCRCREMPTRLMNYFCKCGVTTEYRSKGSKYVCIRCDQEIN